MAAKAKKPDYNAAILSARASRISNAVLCGIGVVSLVGAAVCGWLWFADYLLLVLFTVAALLVPLTALFVKNLGEIKSIERIAKTGTYAAKLSQRQQDTIRVQLSSQGKQFYFTAFLVVATIEAIILVVLSDVFDNELYLLLMALFSLAAISVAAVASMYLSARLRVRGAFATVSSKGVLTSREVLPFEAKNGEVLSLIRFDDYYRIEFIKREIFGIRRRGCVIVPTDGVLKNGIGGSADEVLARTLALQRITVIHSNYYPSRDYSEQAVNALAAETMLGAQG